MMHDGGIRRVIQQSTITIITGLYILFVYEITHRDYYYEYLLLPKYFLSGTHPSLRLQASLARVDAL